MGANLAPASTRCCRCSADSCAAWGLLSICWFIDRKSTRLNSSHSQISYAVFCLKKKKTPTYNCVIATHQSPSPSSYALLPHPLHPTRTALLPSACRPPAYLTTDASPVITPCQH